MDDEKFLSKLTPEQRSLRSKVDMLDYQEARRLRGPVYEVIAMELEEESCFVTRCHFLKLIEKETDLYETEAIRVRVMDRPKLLWKTYELAKRAEIQAKLQTCTDWGECLMALYKILQIFEPLEEFDWLLYDFYKIFMDLFRNIPDEEGMSTKEWMARIYYKAAMYFYDKPEELNNVRAFLHNAFQIVREFHFESGDTEPHAYDTLHQIVGQRYSDVLLKCAYEILSYETDEAIELGHQSVLVLAEIGAESNKMRFCQANLSWAEFYMHKKDFLGALKVLEKIKDFAASNKEREFGILCCNMYLTMGTCYTEINNRDKARRILKQALELSQFYDLKTHEAETQLNYARLFVRNIEDRVKATEAFDRAKEIFLEMGDMKSVLKVEYLMGEMLSTQTFPMLMDLIKAPKEKVCNLYTLYQWKHVKKRYWCDIPLKLDKEDHNRLYCLFDEHYGYYEQPKERKSRKKVYEKEM